MTILGGAMFLTPPPPGITAGDQYGRGRHNPRIAGDIQEIAFLVTAGTLFRGPGRADRKVALAKSPLDCFS